MASARKAFAEFLLPLLKIMLCMLPLRHAKRGY
jgi:hypothetical protein